ncbi:hypothetical protein EVAR_56657_1, partial [Eumeta japonica]
HQRGRIDSINGFSLPPKPEKSTYRDGTGAGAAQSVPTAH